MKSLSRISPLITVCSKEFILLMLVYPASSLSLFTLNIHGS